jgi:hypothetical protein
MKSWDLLEVTVIDQNQRGLNQYEREDFKLHRLIVNIC